VFCISDLETYQMHSSCQAFAAAEMQNVLAHHAVMHYLVHQYSATQWRDFLQGSWPVWNAIVSGGCKLALNVASRKPLGIPAYVSVGYDHRACVMVGRDGKSPVLVGHGGNGRVQGHDKSHAWDGYDDTTRVRVGGHGIHHVLSYSWRNHVWVDRGHILHAEDSSCDRTGQIHHLRLAHTPCQAWKPGCAVLLLALVCAVKPLAAADTASHIPPV